nr:MAG TPA: RUBRERYTHRIN TRANSPORT, IRON, FERROXIDASE.1A [Caudoviricetes sp.]
MLYYLCRDCGSTQYICAFRDLVPVCNHAR